jgi:hypothetical protein
MPPGRKSKVKSNIKKVTSIGDLRYKCNTEGPDQEKYKKLAIISARNLGCSQPEPTLEQAFRWLEINASETTTDEFDGEQGVTGEINFCLDLV